jgi:antitoxin component YwqK of YwqJK toxin-antitoxin module
MTNYEDYLKQVADLGGANSKKPLEDFYQINGALIRFFGMINTQFELWLQNKNLDDNTVNHILNTLNQQKATLASLKFELSQTDIADYEGNTRTKLEKQLAYIKSEMVLEEADLVLQNLKQLKTAPKAEPKAETPKNDSNFLRTFLRTEYGEGYTYEGDLLNNLPNGNGALYYPNKQLYAIGSWANGRLQNNAKVYYDDGKIWMEGSFKNGKLSGNGKEHLYIDAGKGMIDLGTMKRKYYELREGEFKKGKLSGEGKIFKDGHLAVSGYFESAELNGYGECFDRGSGSYELELENLGHSIEKAPFIPWAKGIFKNGLLHGNGVIYFDGIFPRIYEEGTFEFNRLVNGKKYKEFRDEKHRVTNHYLSEEGNFKESELHGKGKRYSSDGSLMSEGNYENGSLHGYGKRYDYKGKLECEGQFINGVFQDK